MKNVSQSYWKLLYDGCVEQDNEFSYEYNREWNEEVRRMRENKNIKQKGEKDKNVRIK